VDRDKKLNVVLKPLDLVGRTDPLIFFVYLTLPALKLALPSLHVSATKHSRSLRLAPGAP
jgi:hypothetical protein